VKSNVLVVHEHAEVRVALEGIVRASGCDCRTVGDCATAMQEIAIREPDLVILCGRLDGRPSETSATLAQLIAAHTAIPVFAAGALKNDDISRRAMARVIKGTIADALSRRQIAEMPAHAA
jgi:DNA-binding NtrC family response regulator